MLYNIRNDNNSIHKQDIQKWIWCTLYSTVHIVGCSILFTRVYAICILNAWYAISITSLLNFSLWCHLASLLTRWLFWNFFYCGSSIFGKLRKAHISNLPDMKCIVTSCPNWSERFDLFESIDLFFVFLIDPKIWSSTKVITSYMWTMVDKMHFLVGVFLSYILY